MEQARRDRIARRRQELVSGWEEGWRRMVGQWRQDGSDAVWLMYSANYLFRTAGVRWAIDPVTLRNLVHEAEPVTVEELAELNFVLLTHNHSDHVDRALLQRLAQVSEAKWIIPRHMLPVAEAVRVRPERIIVPEPMQTLCFGQLRVTVFDGLHWEYSGRWNVGNPQAGIDATGCMVEWGDNRVLFPGDTRTYDIAALPSFGTVSTLFAHVWLGRGAALETPPPLLEAMSDFVTGLSPQRRVFLAHLWQVARGPGDYWDETHAAQLQAILEQRLPEIDVTIPNFWSKILL